MKKKNCLSREKFCCLGNHALPVTHGNLSSGKLDMFNHPDSDDPIAQTLYKMIEPDDKVSAVHMYI